MKWEYLTIKFDTHGVFTGGKVDISELDRDFNKLGQEGWELVSALDTSMEGGESRHILAIFKREKI